MLILFKEKSTFFQEMELSCAGWDQISLIFARAGSVRSRAWKFRSMQIYKLRSYKHNQNPIYAKVNLIMKFDEILFFIC